MRENGDGALFYSAQVGLKLGPKPVLARDGATVADAPPPPSPPPPPPPPPQAQHLPRPSHRVIIAGANIINLPVPGPGSDYI